MTPPVEIFESFVLPPFDPDSSEQEVSSRDFCTPDLLSIPNTRRVMVGDVAAGETAYFPNTGADLDETPLHNPDEARSELQRILIGRNYFNYTTVNEGELSELLGSQEVRGQLHYCFGETADSAGNVPVYLYDPSASPILNHSCAQSLPRVWNDLTDGEIIQIVQGVGLGEPEYCVGADSAGSLIFYLRSDPFDDSYANTVVERVRALSSLPEPRREAIATSLWHLGDAPRRNASSMSRIFWVTLFLGAAAVIPAYFMARQQGWTKPIDPLIDRAFARLWRLFGLRPQVDFMRQITPEMVQRGEIRPAVGRDADYVRLRERLRMNRSRVTTIIARGGEGKTHFVLGFAREIFEGRVPELDPNTTRFFELNLNDLLGDKDSKYVGGLQERFNDFVKQVEAEAAAGRTVFVFIDEIHRLAGMGTTEGGGANDLGNAAKNKISEWERILNIRLTGATTTPEYPQLIRNPQTGLPDEAMRRRYPPFRLSPLSRPLLLEIVNDAAGRWEMPGRPRIPQTVRERALDLGFHPDVQIANPDAALTILDMAQVRAETRGLPEVTVAIVNEVFAEDTMIKEHPLEMAAVGDWRFNQAEYDQRMAAATAVARSGRPAPTPTAPAPGNGAGAPRVVRTGWEEVLTYSVNDRAIYDALAHVDRGLAEYYRANLSPAGRPVSTMGDLVEAMRSVNPGILEEALTSATMEGRPVSQVPERAIFEMVARSAEGRGNFTDGDPTVRMRMAERFEAEVRNRSGIDGTERPPEADPAERERRRGGRRRAPVE